MQSSGETEASSNRTRLGLAQPADHLRLRMALPVAQEHSEREEKPGQKQRRWCQELGSAASCTRIRRTATFRGSREVGQRAQVPDQQESAFFFSSFLLLKQVLKKLELKSIGHKQEWGRERPETVRTGGEYHFYNLSISDRVD